ncbi:proton-conducting transporter membrane subunit [Wenzhouxiangella limi]|uniref:Oxidoreductase n=1 Tax=Wenzhouxiangella limi TaxID=2707351 RepID=A0A845UWI2_9GAMM|nr:proton-conducting transporter membrane subunit [Wenzhouxiangella limi]NDY94180.1 oxidoreductase [Wenzhouxiangella limi]
MVTELFDLRPVLAPLVSALCALGIVLLGHHERWRIALSLAAAVVKFALVWSMLPATLSGTVFVFNAGEILPGLPFAFRVDALGMFFALVSSTLWVLTTIYAIAYMRGSHALRRFFGFFALCISTTVAIAFAENLLTLFIFYELLTLCTYPLVIHSGTLKARRAGRRYLAYTLSGGAALLAGMALLYHLTGSLSLSQPGLVDPATPPKTLLILFVLLIGGFAVKAAVMPLHAWLPSAMVAPTPVSALLHAVAVVKAGSFGLLRVIYNVFGVNLLASLGYTAVLAVIAALTIIVASLMALRQDVIKLRLAWSTISQLSYIVLAACLLTPLAALAAVIHIANQAFAKITLFFVAGAIEKRTGKTRVSELDGLGQIMPWTMGACTIACLSFMGVPLLAGFITKWYLSAGALAAGMPIYVAVMMLSALLNATYWLPIIYRAYFKPCPDPSLSREEPEILLLGPILACAAYVVLLGIGAQAPAMPFALAESAVNFAFGLELSRP